MRMAVGFAVARAALARRDYDGRGGLYRLAVPSIRLVGIGVQRKADFVPPLGHFGQGIGGAVHPPGLDAVDVHVGVALPGGGFAPGLGRRKGETRQLGDIQVGAAQRVGLQPEIDRHRGGGGDVFRAVVRLRFRRFGDGHVGYGFDGRAVPGIRLVAVGVQLDPDFPAAGIQPVQVKPRGIDPPDFHPVNVHVGVALAVGVFPVHVFRGESEPVGDDLQVDAR